MEKAAYLETTATDVSNKVDKRKRQRAGAVGGLGCGEQSFDEFSLSFAKFCGLPPLYENFENVQHSSTKIRTIFRTFASRKWNHASILLTNVLKSQAILLRAKWMRRQRRGASSNTPGLVFLGLSRPHQCGTLFQQSPCWLDETSNGRTTPQHER
jgi:hypothetical protein